jgi:hypothetical protein
MKNHQRASLSLFRLFVVLFSSGTFTLGFVPPSHYLVRLPDEDVKNITPSKTLLREKSSNGFLDRFTNPLIQDPGLPLTDAGIAQIVAPSLEIFWLVFNDLPYPTWARPINSDLIFPGRGSFLAPTLIHGAGLSCCWLLGCLAARAFEKEAFEGSVTQVLLSTVKAGAFATGLLIFCTQINLFFELGGYVQLGESPESDRRILIAADELAKDIFFEATVLLSWRLLRSKLNDTFFMR